MSDRNAKENFAEVDEAGILDKLLELPVTTWNYRSQDPSIRHIGPTAQDFHAAFGVGDSATGINDVDAHGVSMAAIKGLCRKLETRNAELERQLQEREEQIKVLARRVELLAAARNPTHP